MKPACTLHCHHGSRGPAGRRDEFYRSGGHLYSHCPAGGGGNQAAEPNTRTLLARCAVTTRRMAARLIRSAAEGFMAISVIKSR